MSDHATYVQVTCGSHTAIIAEYNMFAKAQQLLALTLPSHPSELTRRLSTALHHAHEEGRASRAQNIEFGDADDAEGVVESGSDDPERDDPSVTGIPVMPLSTSLLCQWLEDQEEEREEEQGEHVDFMRERQNRLEASERNVKRPHPQDQQQLPKAKSASAESMLAEERWLPVQPALEYISNTYGAVHALDWPQWEDVRSLYTAEHAAAKDGAASAGSTSTSSSSCPRVDVVLLWFHKGQMFRIPPAALAEVDARHEAERLNTKRALTASSGAATADSALRASGARMQNTNAARALPEPLTTRPPPTPQRTQQQHQQRDLQPHPPSTPFNASSAHRTAFAGSPYSSLSASATPHLSDAQALLTPAAAARSVTSSVPALLTCPLELEYPPGTLLARRLPLPLAEPPLSRQELVELIRSTANVRRHIPLRVAYRVWPRPPSSNPTTNNNHNNMNKLNASANLSTHLSDFGGSPRTPGLAARFGTPVTGNRSSFTSHNSSFNRSGDDDGNQGSFARILNRGSWRRTNSNWSFNQSGGGGVMSSTTGGTTAMYVPTAGAPPLRAIESDESVAALLQDTLTYGKNAIRVVVVRSARTAANHHTPTAATSTTVSANSTLNNKKNSNSKMYLDHSVNSSVTMSPPVGGRPPLPVAAVAAEPTARSVNDGHEGKTAGGVHASIPYEVEPIRTQDASTISRADDNDNDDTDYADSPKSDRIYSDNAAGAEDVDDHTHTDRPDASVNNHNSSKNDDLDSEEEEEARVYDENNFILHTSSGVSSSSGSYKNAGASAAAVPSVLVKSTTATEHHFSHAPPTASNVPCTVEPLPIERSDAEMNEEEVAEDGAAQLAPPHVVETKGDTSSVATAHRAQYDRVDDDDEDDESEDAGNASRPTSPPSLNHNHNDHVDSSLVKYEEADADRKRECTMGGEAAAAAAAQLTEAVKAKIASATSPSPCPPSDQQHTVTTMPEARDSPVEGRRPSDQLRSSSQKETLHVGADAVKPTSAPAAEPHVGSRLLDPHTNDPLSGMRAGDADAHVAAADEDADAPPFARSLGAARVLAMWSTSRPPPSSTTADVVTAAAVKSAQQQQQQSEQHSSQAWMVGSDVDRATIAVLPVTAMNTNTSFSPSEPASQPSHTRRPHPHSQQLEEDQQQHQQQQHSPLLLPSCQREDTVLHPIEPQRLYGQSGEEMDIPSAAAQGLVGNDNSHNISSANTKIITSHSTVLTSSAETVLHSVVVEVEKISEEGEDGRESLSSQSQRQLHGTEHHNALAQHEQQQQQSQQDQQQQQQKKLTVRMEDDFGETWRNPEFYGRHARERAAAQQQQQQEATLAAAVATAATNTTATRNEVAEAAKSAREEPPQKTNETVANNNNNMNNTNFSGDGAGVTAPTPTVAGTATARAASTTGAPTSASPATIAAAAAAAAIVREGHAGGFGHKPAWNYSVFSGEDNDAPASMASRSQIAPHIRLPTTPPEGSSSGAGVAVMKGPTTKTATTTTAAATGIAAATLFGSSLMPPSLHQQQQQQQQQREEERKTARSVAAPHQSSNCNIVAAENAMLLLKNETVRSPSPTSRPLATTTVATTTTTTTTTNAMTTSNVTSAATAAGGAGQINESLNNTPTRRGGFPTGASPVAATTCSSSSALDPHAMVFVRYEIDPTAVYVTGPVTQAVLQQLQDVIFRRCCAHLSIDVDAPRPRFHASTIHSSNNNTSNGGGGGAAGSEASHANSVNSAQLATVTATTTITHAHAHTTDATATHPPSSGTWSQVEYVLPLYAYRFTRVEEKALECCVAEVMAVYQGLEQLPAKEAEAWAVATHNGTSAPAR